MSNKIHEITYSSFKRDMEEAFKTVPILISVNKKLINDNWHTVAKDNEKEIILSMIPKYGNLIDIIEVKVFASAPFYRKNTNEIIILDNNALFLAEGKEIETGAPDQRVFLCLFDYGLLIISGETYYENFYFDLLFIDFTNQMKQVKFSSIPHRHLLLGDGNVQELDTVLVRSQEAYILLSLFVQFFNNKGGNIHVTELP